MRNAKGQFVKGHAVSRKWKESVAESSKTRVGEKHPLWKGIKADYATKHQWLYAHYGKASKCENPNCIYPRVVGFKENGRWGKKMVDKPKIYEWANISGKYLRNRKDYIQLCPSCHRKWDKKLIKINLKNI